MLDACKIDKDWPIYVLVLYIKIFFKFYELNISRCLTSVSFTLKIAKTKFYIEKILVRANSFCLLENIIVFASFRPKLMSMRSCN